MIKYYIIKKTPCHVCDGGGLEYNQAWIEYTKWELRYLHRNGIDREALHRQPHKDAYQKWWYDKYMIRVDFETGDIPWKTSPCEECSGSGEIKEDVELTSNLLNDLYGAKREGT